MPFWGITGIPRHSLYSYKLRELKVSLISSIKSFKAGSEFSLDRDVDLDSVHEVVEYRRGFRPHEGNNVAVPLEMIYLALMFLDKAIANSLTQKNRDCIEVVLTLGKEALDCLSSSMKSSSTFNWDFRGEMAFANLSVTGREAMHQSLLECFSTVLRIARNIESTDGIVSRSSISEFVKKYFAVLELMHDVLDNERKLFVKYISMGMVRASLDTIAESSEFQFKEELNSFLALAFFNESLLEELYRVSLKVTSGTLLREKDKDGAKRHNPYHSFFAELHEYALERDTKVAMAVGWLFACLLAGSLKRAEIQRSDRGVAHDKRKVLRSIKLCHAFILQAAPSDETSLSRNEILSQLQESSSILTQYDPGHDFLAMFEALWADTKTRLTRQVLSEADFACEIRCTTELLRVHHRLLLDDEEREHDCLVGLTRMCRLIYYCENEVKSDDLYVAQEALVLLLMELFHSLGKLEVLSSHLCRAAAGVPREKVDLTLSAPPVQSLLSRSFAELSEVQVVNMWKVLEAEADIISHLEDCKRLSAFNCLSWVAHASINVIISQPLSKRVNAKRIAVPTTALFALLEISIDDMKSKEESSSNRGRALATLLLRVASSQVSQLSSAEMASSLTEWRPFFELVSNKLVRPSLDMSRNKNGTDVAGLSTRAVTRTKDDDFLSYLLLFSAVNYVFITQLQSEHEAFPVDAAKMVLQVVELYLESERATGDRPLLLLQHADLVEHAAQSKVKAVVMDALLSECKVLESLFLRDDGDFQQWACMRDNCVVAEVLSQAYASSLARVGQLVKGKMAISAEKQVWALRLMKFCRHYARLDRLYPLKEGQEEILIEIVFAGVERVCGSNSKRSQSTKKKSLKEIASIVDIAASLLVWSVQGTGILPRALLRGWAWKEKANSLLLCACHEDLPSIAPLLNMLMSKRLEDKSRNTEEGSAEALVEDVEDLCKALIVPSPETTHDYTTRIKSIGVLRHCLSRINWTRLYQAKKKIAMLIDKHVDAQVYEPIATFLSTKAGCPLSIEQVKTTKYYTQVVLLRSSVGIPANLCKNLEGLLRHIVSCGLNHVTAEALTVVLGVVGDVLEAHREAGMVMASQSSAEIIFEAIMRLLQQIHTRPVALRVGLVRVLSELHQLRRDPELSRACLERMKTYRCCSSDAIDVSRAMLTVCILEKGFMDTQVVSSARALLLDASSKIHGVALAPRIISDVTSFAAMDNPTDLLLSAKEEEVAFFHCIMGRNTNARKRRQPGDDLPTLVTGEGESTEVRSELVTRVIFTYVVMTSQLNILSAQSSECESEMAMKTVEHCLTMLQEISLHLSSALEYCFPVLSLGIARTLHYVLQAGEVMDTRESRALAIIRRILLNIANMRNLKRYFAGAAATIIEVLAASGRRRGLDGILSGVFALADGCGGFRRKTPIAPLLSPTGKALLAELTETYFTTIKYTG